MTIANKIQSAYLQYDGDIKAFIQRNLMDGNKLLSSNLSKRSFYMRNGLEGLLHEIESNSPITSQNIYPHIFCIIKELEPRCLVCNCKLDGSHYRSDGGGRMMDYCSKTCRTSKKGKEIHNKKTRKGILSVYGVDNIMHSKIGKEKHKKSIKGVDYNNRNKNSINTNIKRLGVEHPTQNVEVLKKRQQTNLKRYGVKEITELYDIVGINHKKNNWYRSLDRQWNDYDTLYDLYITQEKSSIEIGKLWNIDPSTVSDYLNRFKIPIRGYSVHNKSLGETELFEYVESIYNNEIKTNVKLWKDSKMDVDIYLPDLKLAIEFDGLYWHGTSLLTEADARNKQIRKHLINGSYNTDLNVINVYEDEWIFKQDIIKKYIHDLIIGHDSKYYARKLRIKPVDVAESNEFYNKYHIQGSPAITTFSLGLYNGHNLVSCMSFKIINRKCELIRYAGDLVIGGFPKLLKHSIDLIKNNYHINQIVSFLDVSKFNPHCNVYIRNGFITDCLVKPDYYVVYKGRRRHKFNLRKSKLITLCKDNELDVNPNDTEFILHDRLNMSRIYDAGKVRYVLNI